MADMLAVELVENVLVDVLGVLPDTVLPHACVVQDLGASSKDVVLIFQRLQAVLSASDANRLTADAGTVPVGGFTVQELVNLVERTTRHDRACLRKALFAQAQRAVVICEPRMGGAAAAWTSAS